jgi:hypothetical protein
MEPNYQSGLTGMLNNNGGRNRRNPHNDARDGNPAPPLAFH